MMDPTSPPTSIASPDQIRSHFPALERRHNGQPVAYFDGPGGTQVPRRVVEAMTDYLYHHNANTHWAFPTSRETDEAIADARQALADFLNASPEEVAFGANMTTLTFHLARALGRGWGPGDEIVVTELDHHANVDPWRALARERGVTVRVARMVPETGQLDRDDLSRQITGRTRLVAIGAASNALGTINDVAEAARLAHDAGALVVRRCRPLRPAPAGRCPGHGLRLPGLLGVQVLRAARRRPVRQARPAPGPRRAQAPARPRTRPRSGWRPGRRTTRGSSGRRRPSSSWPRSPTGPTRRARLRAAFDALARAGRRR